MAIVSQSYTMLAIELFGLLAIALVGTYVYFKRVLYTFWSKRGVVSMTPTIPAGCLSKVVTGKLSAGEVFLEAYQQFGKNRVFGTYTFHKPNLVVCDPELIKFVLAKEFSSFHDRGLYCNEKNDPLSGHLFFLPGLKWRNLRVKLTPTFTSGKIKQMFGIIKETSDQLATYLESKAKNRETLELKDLFARYMTDTIMSTAFGVKCNCLEEPESEFRIWGRKVFEPRQIVNSLVMFAPQLMDLFNIPFTQKGVQDFFMRTFRENVEYRREHKVTRHDFMNLLVQLMTEGHLEDEAVYDTDGTTKARITMSEAAAQAYVFFLAGFETSSSVASYCLYELSLNQDIQEKTRQEIDAVLKKHGELTYDSISEMTYLHKVVSETLRKYPPLPFLNRVCTKSIDLADTGFHVEEGLDITIPILGLHRDPDIYPEPERFDPERFTEENIASRHPYTYLPFGEGPRICIGLRFGMTQSKVALVSVLSKYRFTLSPITPVPLSFDPGLVVLTALGGILLKIEPR